MSLGPADSEPGGEPGQGKQSADDVPAWLAPGDAQGDEHAGAECFGETEPEAEDAKVLAGRVVRGEGEGDLEAGGGVPQLAGRGGHDRGEHQRRGDPRRHTRGE